MFWISKRKVCDWNRVGDVFIGKRRYPRLCPLPPAWRSSRAFIYSIITGIKCPTCWRKIRMTWQRWRGEEGERWDIVAEVRDHHDAFNARAFYTHAHVMPMRQAMLCLTVTAKAPATEHSEFPKHNACELLVVLLFYSLAVSLRGYTMFWLCIANQ